MNVLMIRHAPSPLGPPAVAGRRRREGVGGEVTARRRSLYPGRVRNCHVAAGYSQERGC